jgi:hypothetical protein
MKKAKRRLITPDFKAPLCTGFAERYTEASTKHTLEAISDNSASSKTVKVSLRYLLVETLMPNLTEIVFPLF